MPRFYCQKCNKVQHHKVVVQKATSENPTVTQQIATYINVCKMFLQGHYYHQVVKVTSCRICNETYVPQEAESIQNQHPAVKCVHN